MKSLYLPVLSLLFAINAFAQQEEPPSRIHFGYFNGHLMVAVPANGLADNIKKVGLGGGGNILIGLGDRLPFFVGVEVNSVNYELETKRLSGAATGDPNKIRTGANIFMLHGMVRFAPYVNFFIQPYIDGMIGTKNFFTRTSIEYKNDENTESYIEQGDWAFSYGGALGLRFRVFKDRGVTLDLRGAYLPGAIAKYMVRSKDNIDMYDEPIELFEEKQSETSLTLIQIGVTANLWKPDKHRGDKDR